MSRLRRFARDTWHALGGQTPLRTYRVRMPDARGVAEVHEQMTPAEAHRLRMILAALLPAVTVDEVDR